MDTALAAYIINPSQRTYDLEEIAERHARRRVGFP